ncbi:MAG: myo-inositol-1-phosphate synthase [Planctomycetes bacterium]|nr:myo-inositol-1-phosphate synthase [Planctomycetota bacterium]
MAKHRTGIWLIGAKGGVGTTCILGIAALRRRLTDTIGLVSELPPFGKLPLADWKDLVVGGHDVRETSLYEESLKLQQVSRALDGELIRRCKTDLDQVDGQIRPGILFNAGRTIEKLADDPRLPRREPPRAAIERAKEDIESFRRTHRLERVVVVNVASTEPPVDGSAIPERWSDLAPLLDKPRRCPLASSSLYAVAAFEADCPFINFTPSAGASSPALCGLALDRGLCHMGHDGKTGETLLKSVLAPMFAHRNLEIMSWVGHNIFGNMDGLVLDDPANKRTKVQSKDRLLRHILGYAPQTHVSIEYIRSLGDWKTAWDHVHFRGFLNTPMMLQFTWQGCDSLLAAPLVLDLVRFTDLAVRLGSRGLLTFLASFFKSPHGVDEHDFHRQFAMLEEWVASAATR